MDGTDLLRIARLVAATPGQIHTELEALGETGATFHPAPGEWCAKEVVGHLTEADRRGFSGRVRQILATDRPDLQAWDQPAVAIARRDCDKPWEDVLEEFRAVRVEGLLLFDQLTDADFGRSGMHPLVGELSVRDLLHEWPFHDRDHLKQILDNTRALVWEDMGAAQGFSSG